MKTYTTKSGSSYTASEHFTGTVVSVASVDGSAVNKAWNKPVRLVTIKHTSNKMETYITTEAGKITIGHIIKTHVSANKDGYEFISLRHIKS